MEVVPVALEGRSRSLSENSPRAARTVPCSGRCLHTRSATPENSPGTSRTPDRGGRRQKREGDRQFRPGRAKSSGRLSACRGPISTRARGSVSPRSTGSSGGTADGSGRRAKRPWERPSPSPSTGARGSHDVSPSRGPAIPGTRGMGCPKQHLYGILFRVIRERESAADGGASAPLRKVPPPTGNAAAFTCGWRESWQWHRNGTPRAEQ